MKILGYVIIGICIIIGLNFDRFLSNVNDFFNRLGNDVEYLGKVSSKKVVETFNEVSGNNKRKRKKKCDSVIHIPNVL